MQIAPGIASHLDKLSIQYDLLIHEDTPSLEMAAASLNLPEYMVARAVVLRDHDFICMAVLPLNYIIDFVELKGLTQRNLQPVAINLVNEMFADCEPGTIPPFGGIYNMETYYDSSLLNAPAIIFEAGDHRHFIRLTQEEFRRVVEANNHGSFAKSLEALRFMDRSNKPMLSLPEGVNLGAHYRQFTPLTDERKSLEAIEGLPVIPTLTNDLLRLYKRGNVSATEIGELVSLHADIAQQLLYYAGVIGALSDQEQKPANLQTAITNSLGIELALALAIALSVFNSFHVQPLGPIGKRTLMSQAVLTAWLCLLIYDHLPKKPDLNRGELFLSGLLHNFGFILFGHLFQSKYYLLNKLVQTNPEIKMIEFESLLSKNAHEQQNPISHTHIAATVLADWQMPDSVIATARFHHDAEYHGEHQIEANIVLLANTLMKPHFGGDGNHQEVPDSILLKWGLNERDLNTLTEQVVEKHVDSALPISRAFHPI